MTTPSSFMDLLQDAEVDLGASPLEPFGEEVEEDEEDEGDDEEDVAEIGEEAFTVASRPHARSTNYTEAEDILLEIIVSMRYKEMAASKGKPFPFKHAWEILQTFDKWKLRDQETAPKKSATLRMDDSEDEEKERNLGKPEGTKKRKQRVKMEGEASSLMEKMEQMMKAREELTRKTLETKILITEKKKEVKLAQVEAKREEAKRKADFEERMIKVKEAKVWKKLMVEEKEHMMMSKKDMDQEQLQWWKDYKEDIAERKRIFRGASSTLRAVRPSPRPLPVEVVGDPSRLLTLPISTRNLLERSLLLAAARSDGDGEEADDGGVRGHNGGAANQAGRVGAEPRVDAHNMERVVTHREQPQLGLRPKGREADDAVQGAPGQHRQRTRHGELGQRIDQVVLPLVCLVHPGQWQGWGRRARAIGAVAEADTDGEGGNDDEGDEPDDDEDAGEHGGAGVVDVPRRRSRRDTDAKTALRNGGDGSTTARSCARRHREKRKVAPSM
ncbi:DNA mismatch repair protein Msh6-1 [Hordeum vulgare]|nr:DNA mismatch repair protein Msh6-1 [Hordeum vulgare]